MKRTSVPWRGVVFPAFLLGLTSCTTSTHQSSAPPATAKTAKAVELAQVPSWSRDDLEFFLHGSMSTEFVPEDVLRAFAWTYDDLFPSHPDTVPPDLPFLGLISDPTFGWPVGFSRSRVPHLGGLSAVGVNCAACHVGEVWVAPGIKPVRVLGMTSHFDAEAFFGAVIVASFRTADPTNMKRFLTAYLDGTDPVGKSRNISQIRRVLARQEKAKEKFSTEWQRQEQRIIATLTADPFGAKGTAAGSFYALTASDLRLTAQRLEEGMDLAALCGSMTKLFHNMRTALHVPDQPPEKAPPASGPGRNDAFGLLSAILFGTPQPYAPVKYGLVWNLDHRHWVHWDGNTQSPIGRNLLASLGLGAPLMGKRGQLDFALVQRHTDLSERIRPPQYPFAIDEVQAKRGAVHYKAKCASCHDGTEGDRRLYDVAEIGTEPNRARMFTREQADHFNKFLAELDTPGYTASKEPGIRNTQKYWAASLAGVWARSPYLHNGSVRTMQELLTAPGGRAKSFRRGSQAYNPRRMGYTDGGGYVLDTASPGSSNAGHNYGTELAEAEKRELIEHLKTL